MKKTFWELVFEHVTFKHILTLVVVIGCFQELHYLIIRNILTTQIATAYLAILPAIIYYWIQSAADSAKKTQALIDSNKAKPAEPETKP